jgi:hypothetical protein
VVDRETQQGLWFEEDEPRSSSRSCSGNRRMWVVLASMACVAALAVPVSLALTSSASRAPAANSPQSALPHLPRGAAERQVLTALSATTSSGSFNVTYEFDPATPPTETTTTTTTPYCKVVGSMPPGNVTQNGVSIAPPSECVSVGGPGASAPSVAVNGQGTIDTDPFAMVAVSNVTGFGQITLRDNGTNVWEFGGGDYGLAPGSTETGPGASLSGFAGLVEGTLGQRQGALAMSSLASPTGYLDLDQSMITGADQTGTGTVDGVPVTVYEISINPAQAADVPGINAEEAKTIAAAAAVLQTQGYTGTTVQVSIDASGYIRQTRSVAHFSDGSTTTSEATFSDFGCAGTVLMPGQTGPSAPPAGCVSPDTGVAPTTSTTSTTGLPTTATSPPATSTTSTEAPAPATSSTSTTLPPVTTTTFSSQSNSG